MKRIKKFASLVLAMVMVLAMAIPAMAAETTGSIVIKGNSTVSVEGRTFVAYKILDATTADVTTGTAYAYTVPDVLKAFYADKFEVSVDEQAFNTLISDKINDLTTAEAVQEFANAVLNEITETKEGKKVLKAGYADIQAGDPVTGVAGTTSAASTATFTDLPMGYYLIVDTTTGSIVSSLMLATPTANITIKANNPVPEKMVENPTYSIGDSVKFTLSADVPNMDGYDTYRFAFEDTLDNSLDFTDVSANTETAKTGVIQVKVGDKVLSRGSLSGTDVTGGDYALVVDQANPRHLTFTFDNFIQYKNQVGQKIVIEYYATLNENAKIGTDEVTVGDETKTGNVNKVYIKFDRYPTNHGEGDTFPPEPTDQDPFGVSEEIKVEVYTTKVQINKVDGTDSTVMLPGAQFRISGTSLNQVVVDGFKFVEKADGAYWKLKDGSYTTDDPESDGMDTSQYENISIKYDKVAAEINDADPVVIESKKVDAVAEVGEDGMLTFQGLGKGEYTITEVKAPNGYNIMTESIVVNVGFDDEGFTFTGANNAPLTNATVGADGTVTLTIENNQGSLLPSTGGIGTTIFYVVGGILIVGAGILLVTKKRMSAR